MHDSLQKSGEVGDADLKYFDQQDADLLLYELRFLEFDVRPAAATYIAQKQLDVAVRAPLTPTVAPAGCCAHAHAACAGAPDVPDRAAATRAGQGSERSVCGGLRPVQPCFADIFD